MGREEGGGFKMGNTCIPVVDSFRYLAKPVQYVKFKNKIEFKKKKRKNEHNMVCKCRYIHNFDSGKFS